MSDQPQQPIPQGQQAGGQPQPGQPMGGSMPMQGQPMPQGQGAAGQGAAPVTDDQNDEAAIQEFLNSTPPPEPRGSAFKGSQAFMNFSTTVKIPEHPATVFDEKYFLYLFSGSLSLSVVEKKNIIAKVPELSQFQIDELVKILEEEKQKFDQLEAKHPEQVQKLRATAAQEWQLLEMEEQKQATASTDQSQVDDIRKQLGL